MNKKQTVPSLSENTRQAIIIAAIVVVAVIILSISLALILRPNVKTPDDQNSGSTGSSSLTIRNGDFAYTTSDDTAFPKTAQDWTRYGYKKPSDNKSTHEFESITTHEKAAMGIVDTSNWDTVLSNLSDEGLDAITNPGKRDEDSADNNVYMIATKDEAMAASILSESFSVSSGASVKISLWLNTAQLEEGNAVIMIQKSTVSALEKYWYAYKFNVEKNDDGWQEFTFHIFNRETSTQYVRLSVGIGNVYSGEDSTPLVNGKPATGKGVLFIDDITYETVTADEYRQVVDEGDEAIEKIYQPYKILENEDITDESIFLPLVGENDEPINSLEYVKEFTTSEEYLADTKVSPFTTKDDFKERDGAEQFTIYKLTGGKNIVGLRLTDSKLNSIKSSLIVKDHHHISFWIRVSEINAMAVANIHIQTKSGSEWVDLNDGVYNWMDLSTSQDIEEDNNAGWVKYNIYFKPSSVTTEISILITFGDESEKDYAPKGDLYVTKPAYETISYKDYNDASSTPASSKKIDLVGSSANPSVTNGSFSSLSNTGLQPFGWTPAFGGDNAIYNDGQGNQNEGLNKLASTVAGSGVEQDSSANAPVYDDYQKNILKLVNKEATSFGYISSNITLSAKSAYVISVLAKGTPYIYLLNNDNLEADRTKRVIASIDTAETISAQKNADNRLLGQVLSNDELNDGSVTGWSRYYFIVVTADESQTLRVALFNGSIDGSKTTTDTVYYDQVQITRLATYSFVENEDEDEAEDDAEETKLYDVEWNNNEYFSANKEFVEKYGKDFGELLEKDVLETWGITVDQPDEDKWLEMRTIPDEEEEEDTTGGTPSTGSDNEVDLGLLFSVISSIALVAALGVVIVLKLFKNKKSNRKAA